MLFGRQDAADWVELQISGNNHALILNASPLIGKTSFLKHIGALQTMPAFNLLVSLSTLALDTSPQGEPEQTLYTVLRAIIDQLLPQLALLNLIDSDYKAISPQMTSSLRALFGELHQKLTAGQKLVLYVDDLHTIVATNMALVSSFLTSLMPLLDDCPALHFVFAINQIQLKQIRHPLLDGAPTFNLSTFTLDASINMITLPVNDILRFDYGVTKRIAEINSHHPYYLTLFCRTLLNRQVHDGWVNQRDFDATLVEILDTPIDSFTQIWEASSWPERAVLAGMAAIQGAHGPIASQEVLRFLQRQSKAVEPEVIMDALDTLAGRGVLTPMGAVSYRFHVKLFRFWLREHTNVNEILAQVNWNRVLAALKSKIKATGAARPASPLTVAPRQQHKKRSRLGPIVVTLTLLLCIVATLGGIFTTQILGIPLAFISPPTPTATPTATPKNETVAPLLDATEEISAQPTPTTPPTPPPVQKLTLPSITYMGRDIDQNWLIYIMNADGSESVPVSATGADDAGPIWSPDGQKLAFVSQRDGNKEIYVMDIDGQNAANVTRHPANDWTPAWSPDGTRLAFSSFRQGSWEIFVMDTTCLNTPETCPDTLTQITSDGNGNLSPAWSADGTRFAFNSKANGNWDIYTMSIAGTDIRQITSAPENDLAPAWSPDDSQIAFESNRENNVEIYIVDVNGGVVQNVTNQPQADDHGPTWSPDGSQLVFYSNREGNWDIFVTTSKGEPVTNLTQTPTRDEQTPAWRP